MSETRPRNGDSSPSADSTENRQLASPVLTPICEHGESAEEQLSGLESGSAGNIEEDGTVNTVSVWNGSAQKGRVHSPVHARKSSSHAPGTPRLPNGDASKMLKLSPRQIRELVTSPDSLPIRSASPPPEDVLQLDGLGISDAKAAERPDGLANGQAGPPASRNIAVDEPSSVSSVSATPGAAIAERPGRAARSVSSPLLHSSPLQHRKQSSSKPTRPKPELSQIKTGNDEPVVSRPTPRPSPQPDMLPSPIPPVIPIPPLSLPTYLQLEISSDRPSPLYIHRSSAIDFPYESSKVKFERLMNFLLLTPNLERVLWFGAIACLDAWLYTFTILPLRFLKAVVILAQWFGQNALKEVLDLGNFVYGGIGRVWRRRRESSVSVSRRPSMLNGPDSRKPSATELSEDAMLRTNGHVTSPLPPDRKPRRGPAGYRHRRTRSTPSVLQPNHKADILQGLLILASCFVLMSFDASRMYHSIRGQSAIKLYVIYNVLEVFDRLLGAIGQDILECLFSKETLERDENGRSKLIRPFWMFLLALLYNVIHATALFYQVVTLNVAVNSYSNALLTLLMSNQFVEIKGTVFKKFEKENLFQLTCADVVERFQLWLMLLIIALRNIVEVGGLSISLNSAFSGPGTPTDSFAANATGVPLTSGFVIPKAFTLLPKWTGEVLGPFLIVLGSEALVDSCKHAYIGKFNNVKPNIYGRFLDVLAKDYYSHAFADQNLTKRLGLPVIPLSCLFIRACVQTYHMFLATHMPLPIPSSATSVSLESEAATTSPATTAALQHIDQVFRRALGRSSFGAGADPTGSFSWWSIDDVIAFATMIIFFLALYFILLAFKLVLGMLLLSYSRRRYKGMKERERQVNMTEGRRVGGWGAVEVSDEKRRLIYEDDSEGLRELREKEERGRKAARENKEKGDRFEAVERYAMVAKRIW
jgi:hypothetical protein